MRLIAAALAIIALSSPVTAAGPFRPTGPFDPETVAAEPDYSTSTTWAALPDRRDAPDQAPSGAEDLQDRAGVDVFFVHPTTYLRGERWNAAVDDQAVNAITDSASMRNQASAFNSAGRIYAPRYRQGILYAYLRHDPDSLAARDLAYTDVARAFTHYLDHYRRDRPVILAGHSQGAHHLLRLLEEHEGARNLGDALVAVYLIGVPFPIGKFETTLAPLSPCNSPAQTECVVAWNTVAADADRRRFKQVQLRHGSEWQANGESALACTNPLSWQDHLTTATAPMQLAAVRRSREGALGRVPGPRDARCIDGLLVISLPERSPDFRLTRGRRGDYHVFDIPLFHMNLRRNAEVRARAALAVE